MIIYRMISLVPVTDKDCIIPGRIRERNRNPRTAKNSDSTKPTGGLMEAKRREVIETSDLIFHLKNVSEVLPWRNGASCSVHTIFIRVPSLLNPIPNYITLPLNLDTKSNNNDNLQALSQTHYSTS